MHAISGDLHDPGGIRLAHVLVPVQHVQDDLALLVGEVLQHLHVLDGTGRGRRHIQARHVAPVRRVVVARVHLGQRP